MGYFTLVPVYRALMTSEGRCQSCGHRFEDQGDIQLEHIEPPRSDEWAREHGFDHDWAREHARNLRFLCTACNVAKRDKTNSDWLDDEEEARIANEIHHGGSVPPPPREEALQLPFEDEIVERRDWRKK